MSKAEVFSQLLPLVQPALKTEPACFTSQEVSLPRRPLILHMSCTR